jgi:hypothetical protein
MLAKSRADKRTAREAKLTEGGEAFMPDDRSVAESTSTWGVVNVDPASDLADPTEDLKVPSSKLPWAISNIFLGFVHISRLTTTLQHSKVVVLQSVVRCYTQSNLMLCGARMTAKRL